MHFSVFRFNYKLLIIFSTLIILVFSIYGFVFAINKDTDIKVPIIMYHSVLKSNNGDYIVHPDVLEKDFKYIKENGYTTITLTDLINYVHNDTSLPEKPIIITFDDGHYNNLTYVLPLLEKYDMVAVISIVGKYTDKFTESNDANPNYSYLRWEDISELMNSNRFEFQNHTYNLHSISNTRRGCMKKKNESLGNYADLLSNDVLKLQKGFEEKTGYVPNTFTYPYGLISKESISIIKSLGFKASLSCNEGINYISKDINCLYELKRFNRPSSISTEQFFKKIL